MLRAEPLYRIQLLMLASEAQDAALTLARFGAFNPAPCALEALEESPAVAYREAWLQAEARLSKLLEQCGDTGPLNIPADAEAPALADLEELNAWLKDVWTACLACHESEEQIAEARSRLDALEDTLAKLERLNVNLAHLLRAGSLLAVNIGSLPATGDGGAPSEDPNANQIVLAIDVGSTSPGSREQVLAAANAVMDRLPPADRVATVALPLRMGEFTFTTNRQASRQALQGLTGWSPRLGTQLPFGIVEALGMDRREGGWEAAVSRVCSRGDEFVRLACRADLEAQARVLVSEASARASTTTTSLEVLLRSLARIEGPKTMLFFSEELPTDGARVEVERVARALSASAARPGSR